MKRILKLCTAIAVMMFGGLGVRGESIWGFISDVEETGSWKTGRLADAQKQYAVEMKSSSAETKYAAAINHALTTLAMLSENKLVADTCKQFGFTLDYGTTSIDGDFDFSQPPATNTLVDNAAKQIQPAVEQALKDLDAIPNTWTGKIKLGDGEYSFDEDVFIDRADVLYMKAALKSALGAVNLIKGYDTQWDWNKFKADFELPEVQETSKVETVPSAPLCEADEYLEAFQVSRVGGKIYVRIVGKKDKLSFANCMGYLFLDFKNKSNSFSEGSETTDIRIGYGVCKEGVDIYNGYGFEAEIISYSDTEIVFAVDANELLIEGDEFDYLEEVDFHWSNYYKWEDSFDFYDPIYHSLLYRCFNHQTGLFDKVRNVTALSAAKTYIADAIKLAKEADALLQKRTSSETFLVNYDSIDEKNLKYLRDNLDSALASLSSAQSFNWHSIVRQGTADEYSFLPNPMRVNLAPLFAGKVTRSTVLPPNVVGTDDDYVAGLDLMKDTTLGGALPDMTLSMLDSLCKKTDIPYRNLSRKEFEYGGDIYKWETFSDSFSFSELELMGGSILNIGCKTPWGKEDVVHAAMPILVTNGTLEANDILLEFEGSGHSGEIGAVTIYDDKTFRSKVVPNVPSSNWDDDDNNWEYEAGNKWWSWAKEPWTDEGAITGRYWAVAKIKAAADGCYGLTHLKVSVRDNVHEEPQIGNCQIGRTEVPGLPFEKLFGGETLELPKFDSNWWVDFSRHSEYECARFDLTYRYNNQPGVKVQTTSAGMIAVKYIRSADGNPLAAKGTKVENYYTKYLGDSVLDHERKEVCITQVSAPSEVTFSSPGFELGGDDEVYIHDIAFYPQGARSVNFYSQFVANGDDGMDGTAYIQGYVTGGGVYKAGSQAVIVAHAGNTAVFDHWELPAGLNVSDEQVTNPVLSFTVPDELCGEMEECRTVEIRPIWRDAEVSGFGACLELPALEINAGTVFSAKYLALKGCKATALPAGLKFDATTGIISGTPTVPGVNTRVRFTRRSDNVNEVMDMQIKIGHYRCSLPLDYENGYTFMPGVAWTDDAMFGSGNSSQWIGWSVSGLPAGVTFDSRTGTFKGAASASDKSYTVIMTKKVNGVTEKGSVTIRTLPYPVLTLKASFDETLPSGMIPPATNGWRLAGAGAYPANKKVTLGVTAPKGWSFAGWYRSGEGRSPEDSDKVDSDQGDYRLPSLPYNTASSNEWLTAKFIPVSEDYLFAMQGEQISLSTAAQIDSSAENYFRYTVSKSFPTISLSGLPAGVKFDAKTLKLSGRPTKAGWYDVAATIKNASGYKLYTVCHISVDGVERPAPTVANDTAGLAQQIDETFGGSVSTGYFFDEEQMLLQPITLGATDDIRRVSVSGLPAGLAWRMIDEYDQKKLVFSGTITKSGKFTVTINVTKSDNKTYKSVRDIYVRDAGSSYLWVSPKGEGARTVSGYGVKYAGEKVSISATANSGYVFAGWYCDEELQQPWTELSEYDGVDYRSASASFIFRPSGSPRILYARFIPVAEDYMIDIPELNGSYEVSTDWNLNLNIASHSLPKATVSGLPAGLKFDAKTNVISGKPTKPGTYKVKIALTNLSVRSPVVKTFLIVVPNITSSVIGGIDPANDCYNYVTGVALNDSTGIELTVDDGYSVSATGLPAGLKFDAKTKQIIGTPTGAPGAYTVTFTARKGTSVEMATITINVEEPPAFAVGLYNGVVFGPDRYGNPFVRGSFKLTSDSKGRISVEIITSKGKSTFTATSWTKAEGGLFELALQNSRSESIEISIDTNLAWDKNQLSGWFTTVDGTDYEIYAQINPYNQKRYFKVSAVDNFNWRLKEVALADDADVTFAMKADGSSTLTGKIGAYSINTAAAVSFDGYKEGAMTVIYTPVITIGRDKRVLAIGVNLWMDPAKAAEYGSGEAQLEQ